MSILIWIFPHAGEEVKRRIEESKSHCEGLGGGIVMLGGDNRQRRRREMITSSVVTREMITRARARDRERR